MSVNLYDILNVQNNCTKKDIKKSYRKLLKEFHPDQPTGNAEMFELIVHAYNILINDKTRHEYDNFFKISSQSESDHFKFKDHAKNYIETQKVGILTKTDKDAKKDFENADKMMDMKHKFNRHEQNEISLKDAIKRFNDIKLAREQEDIENSNDKLFEGDIGSLNMSQFNEAWDKMHKSHTELIQHTAIPYAWNEINESDFGSIENYEDLYNDGNFEGSCEYGSINFDTRKNIKLTKDDIINFEGAKYTSDHNKKDEQYSKSLEEKLKERQKETDIYTSPEFKEFKNFNADPTYGIFSKLGNDTMLNSISWDNDNVTKRYKALLEQRDMKGRVPHLFTEQKKN